MDQQRRTMQLQSVPMPVPASSPLLDDFYELLQSSRTGTTSNNSALKMEPEFSWGAAIPQQQQQQQQLFYDDSLPMVHGAVDMAAAATHQFATGTQIQALRDFMVYGSTTSTPSSFYQSEEVGGPGGVVAGDGIVVPSLAYRTLCNEMYGGAVGGPSSMSVGAERSPHRSQFQRENHILAERQRREEMNEKFSALRAMIPKATKKDKASIVGDTIDYVLELEKRLKQLQACKENHNSINNHLNVFSAKSSKRLRCDVVDGNNNTGGGGGGASTSSETTMNTSHHLHHHLPLPAAAHQALGGDHSVVSSPSDQITAESMLSGKMKDGAAEVDVQQLGKQAVVKVVCSRRPGHVLRVLNALEECKLEVLQSNVMTVADNSIHFVTVQLEDGVSIPTEDLVSAVLQAINPAEA